MLGLVCAYALGRAMQSTLFGTGAMNVPVLLAGSAVLMASAPLACYVRARRASSADPMIAFRQEQRAGISRRLAALAASEHESCRANRNSCVVSGKSFLNSRIRLLRERIRDDGVRPTTIVERIATRNAVAVGQR
jgi:hypothetical protein